MKGIKQKWKSRSSWLKEWLSKRDLTSAYK